MLKYVLQVNGQKILWIEDMTQLASNTENITRFKTPTGSVYSIIPASPASPFFQVKKGEDQPLVFQGGWNGTIEEFREYFSKPSESSNYISNFISPEKILTGESPKYTLIVDIFGAIRIREVKEWLRPD